EGGSFMFNGEQIFAFADSIVTIAPEPPAPIRLWAYQPEKLKDEWEEDEEKEMDTKEKRLKYQTSLEGDKQDILSAFTMTFENPLKTFVPSRISVSTDSSFIPFTGHKFSLDSTAQIVTMNVPWE